MFFGPLFMLLVLVAAVAAIVVLIRWLGGLPGGGGAANQNAPGLAPLDILKARFAKGEINRDEYEERRRVLEA